MQILPILNAGTNKPAINSDQPAHKEASSDFSSVLKNSKFMQNSFDPSGQAEIFSNMFTQVNSAVQYDLDPGRKDFAREELVEQDVDWDNFSTRENFTSASQADIQERDSDARTNVNQEQKNIDNRSESEIETKFGDEANNDPVNERSVASNQAENKQKTEKREQESSSDKIAVERESDKAVQEGNAEKVEQDREGITAKQDKEQAEKDKIEDENREKIARAIDILEKMGVKREEIEKVLQSLEDLDLQNMQDVEKIVTKLLQEKLENAEGKDFSFIEDFLQDLGMGEEKIQQALNKLREGKEQEFVNFLQNFLQGQKGDANINVQKNDVLKLLQSLDLSAQAEKDIQQTLSSLDKDNIDSKELGNILEKISDKLDNGGRSGSELKENGNFSAEFRNWLQNKGLSEQVINKLQQMVQNNITKGSSDSNIQQDIRQFLNSLDKENIDQKELNNIFNKITNKLDNLNQAGNAIKETDNFSSEFRNWLQNKGLSEQDINKLQQIMQNNASKGSKNNNIQQALQNLQAGNQENREEISQLKYSGKNSSAQEEKAFLQQTGKNAGKNRSSEGSFLQRVQQVKSALQSGTGTNNSGSGGQGKDGSSAWKEMWGKIKTTSQGTNEMGAGQKMQDKANTTMQQILGKNSGSGKTSQNQEMRANVLKQVQNGMLRNLNQGGKELTMRLHPPQLGKLNVTLQVQNQEVSALIKSSSPEVAKMIQNQVAELKHVLEQQGLKVQKLEVQTQLAQEESSKNWFSQDEHNQAKDRREQREKRSMRNHWLGKEDEEDMAHSLQKSILEEKSSVSAISVIA